METVMSSIDSPRSSIGRQRNGAPVLPEIADQLQINTDESVPGVLNRTLRSRVLLLQGDPKARADHWPTVWLTPKPRNDAPGIALGFESIDAHAGGSGRLDRVEDCQLWIAGEISRIQREPVIRQLARHILHCGGSLATVAVVPGRSGLLQLCPVPVRALSDSTPMAAARPAPGCWPLTPRLDLLEIMQLLPEAQRFQGRIALLLQFAQEADWLPDDGDDRHAPLRSGVALYGILAERLGTTAACASLSVLIGAVRARNSLDNRLRNMPNDRLGLLLLVAVVRLARRARAFTMREICRELGSVATGT